jgi:mannose/fructose/N-acetylgalactosamine-specific phosphotransferase system component IID
MGWFHLNQLWRLFFLKSSRNNRTIDGLGFFHVMRPALGRSAGDGDELRRSARRHMGYFNANPVLASYIAGVVTNMETRRQAGEDVSAERIDRIKGTLSSVLTARGGYFFELTLIPLGLTIGCIFAIYSSYIGPVIFLVLYNLYHFRSRIGGYLAGMRLGEGVGEELAKHLFPGQRFLEGFSAFASGAFAALVFTRTHNLGGPHLTVWGVLAVTGVFALRRKISFFWSTVIMFFATALFLVVW